MIDINKLNEDQKKEYEKAHITCSRGKVVPIYSHSTIIKYAIGFYQTNDSRTEAIFLP